MRRRAAPSRWRWGCSGVRVSAGKKALQKNFVQQKSTRFKKPLDVLKSNGYVVKC